MNRAIILAAGLGTRLRFLTDHKPKCLVSLFGTTLLEQQVNTLKKCKVEDIHIVTGYCSDQIEALGFPTTKNPRFASTNMVESLFSAVSFMEQEGDLIIAYGDIVYQQNNLQALLASEDDIVLMIDENWRELWTLRSSNPLDDAETLLMDDQGYVTELGKKTNSYSKIQGQYTGLIKVRGEKISSFIEFYQSLDRKKKYDGRDFDNMYMTCFLQLLIDAGWKVKSAIVKNGWLEIDTADDVEVYEKLFNSGELDTIYKMEKM